MVKFAKRLCYDLWKYRWLYILVIPVVLFYILFCYKPIYGLIIAFKDFSPRRGILASPWTDHYGFGHFLDLFNSYYFGRILKNTLTISISTILLGFPAPIIFALLLNEVRNPGFKKITQTISYMPHFISMVVVAGLVRIFVAGDGVITTLLGQQVSLLSKPEYFVPIHVLSGIWQEMGWGAIIYLSALAGVDQELYEAARIDGAGRWKQTLHVTLPGISGTIIIMLLLRIGGVMNVGHEKIILLYNEGIYETADVISSYVYRRGLVDAKYSFSAAVGLFQSIINFIIVIVFNKISKKVTETSLW